MVDLTKNTCDNIYVNKRRVLNEKTIKKRYWNYDGYIGDAWFNSAYECIG